MDVLNKTKSDYSPAAGGILSGHADTSKRWKNDVSIAMEETWKIIDIFLSELYRGDLHYSLC